MSSIDLYLYYGREPRNDVTYGVTHEGPGKKLEINFFLRGKVRDYSAKKTAEDQFEEVEKANYERAGFGLSVA